MHYSCVWVHQCPCIRNLSSGIKLNKISTILETVGKDFQTILNWHWWRNAWLRDSRHCKRYKVTSTCTKVTINSNLWCLFNFGQKCNCQTSASLMNQTNFPTFLCQYQMSWQNCNTVPPSYDKKTNLNWEKKLESMDCNYAVIIWHSPLLY